MGRRGAIAVGIVLLLALLAGTLGPRLLRAPPAPRPERPGPAAEQNGAAPGGAALPSAPEAARDADPEEVRAPETPGVWLVGRVTGLNAPGRARIEIAGIGRAAASPDRLLTAEPGEDGRFAVDAGPLFAGEETLAELEVRVDHPAYLRASSRVAVDEPPEAEYGVEVALVRAAVLRGRVLAPTGGPVAGAGVSVYEMEGGRPGDRYLETTETGADGEYRLRAGAAVEHLVVAAADGLRPAAATVVPKVGAETWVPDLVLREGAAIAGRIRLGGEPVAGADVSAHSAKIQWSLSAGRPLTWSPDRLENAGGSAVAGKEGRYRIEGLEPGSYRVTVGGTPGRILHLDLGEHLRREATAPAGDVDFEIGAGRIELLVRAGGRPLPRQDLMVFSQGIVSMMTNEEGRVAFYGVPGNEYAIEIRHAGHERCEHPVVAPAAGEERLETIDLVPLRPRPSLVVVIRGPDGGPIRKAGFGFYDPPDEHGFFRIRRDSEARDGRHVLANLDPGRFRVLVRPGGEFLGGRSYWLEEEFLVTLPTEGEVVRELTARPGGRLRLTAKDGSGRHPMTTVRIRDVTGEDVPVELVERQQGMASFGGSLLQQEGAELLTPLPAGRYEVTFSAKSCREATVSVSIEAGKTAVVTVTLEPR